MTTTHKTLHFIRVLSMDKRPWALHMPGSFSNIAIISFDTFTVLKMRHQTISKYGYVRPLSTRIRTINPHSVTSLKTDGYFISKTTLFFELVASKVGTMVGNSEVDTINTDGAVRSTIVLETIFPNNLKQQEIKKEISKLQRFDKECYDCNRLTVADSSMANCSMKSRIRYRIVFKSWPPQSRFKG